MIFLLFSQSSGQRLANCSHSLCFHHYLPPHIATRFSFQFHLFAAGCLLQHFSPTLKTRKAYFSYSFLSTFVLLQVFGLFVPIPDFRMAYLVPAHVSLGSSSRFHFRNPTDWASMMNGLCHANAGYEKTAQQVVSVLVQIVSSKSFRQSHAVERSFA